MNTIPNWFTRKIIFIIGLVGLVLHLASRFDVSLGICNSYASKCNDKAYILTIFSFIFIAVFIFFLITFKLKDSVFNTWRNFSVWAIPACLIIVSFFPTNTYGLDVVPMVKGTVAMFLTILYSAISLILIIYKSLKKN